MHKKIDFMLTTFVYLLIGHIFWQYEFGPKLGEGSNSYVHAGTRCKDGLKPGHPKRLPMEIGLTLVANKGPSVPQIIKLLDWQDDPDHYVMVLERPMPSVSMFSFVKLRRRLNEGMARNVMWQVIRAANICCERGVFHRDIKLENLLVNPDTLEVKLIDFGCSTLMKDSAYVAFNGTEMFCPPEFDVDGRYHAKPATVWSLGILLFVMVCGYFPDDKDLHMIKCCQMICSCLQPDLQRRLILEEMQLHDWFMVLRV
uniref:non-specific serine/threonine protein kinase n=1 Tax=Cyprinus carpio TaxID=7962 RepID=A0A8C1JZR7_CYPCA